MQNDLCKKNSIINRHWENKGVQKRKAVQPLADFCRYQIIKPDNTDWKDKGYVDITIRTGNESVRVVNNGITIYATPKIDKSEPLDLASLTYEPIDPFTRTTQTVSAVTTTTGLNRSVYFNSLAGGPASLISEVEIILDGQRVQINTSGFFSATNTLNKLFTPTHVRRDALGHNHILHNENDLKTLFSWYGHGDDSGVLKSFYKNPDFEYALNELNSVGGTGRKVALSGDLDGILFLSKPKNLGLNSILQCDTGLNQHPILPPNCELKIKLKLNDPLPFRMIDTKMSPATYFSDAANTATVPPANDKFQGGKFISLELNEITLTVEKIRWAKEKIQRNMATGSITFNIDQYIFRSRSLPANQTTTLTEFDLPENIGLAYIALGRSNQIYYDTEGHRSSDMTRWCLPPNLEHINFKLNQNTIIFANGLKISREQAFNKIDAIQFYNYLRHRNLTDDSFESFFSKKGNIGFKHIFPIDLTNYNMEKPSKIQIDCTWSPKSPADYYCILFAPQSVTIHKPSRDSIWQTSATVA